MIRERLWAALGAILWAAGGGLAAYQAGPVAVVAALGAAGAGSGFLLGLRAGRSRLRLPTVWIGCLASIVFGRGIFLVLTSTETPSALLGAENVYLAGSALWWFALGLAIAVGLRSASTRFPVFLAAEVGLGCLVVAGLFAAHREGFINRPFFLVDPAWARGFDPLPLFLAIGVVTAFLLMALASTGAGRRRSVADLVWLALLLTTLFLVLPISTITHLEPPGGAGGQQQKDPGKDSGRHGERDEPNFDASPPSQNPPVAVVIFRDDYEPPDGYYYFRQAAFSQFNGRKLVRDTSGDHDRDLARAFPAPEIDLPADDLDAGLHQELETAVALMTTHIRPFGLVQPVALAEANNPDPVRFQRAYIVESLVPTLGLAELIQLPPGNPDWEREEWDHYLEGPKDPRYWALAEEITQTLPPDLREWPMARAVAVKLWLEENGVYSLKGKHGSDSQDAVGEFLFRDLTGYCVHFAHAACYLYRIQGIPARVCGGYAVPATNRGNGSSLLIRGRDGHAWPEVYLEGAGWVVMDIAPRQTLEPALDPPDQGLQQMLGDMARKKGDKDEKRPDRKPRVDLQAAVRQMLAQLVAAVPWAALATLTFLYSIKFIRRIRPRLISHERWPVECYRAQLDRLSDLGLSRSRGQTRTEFACAQRARCPGLEELTRLHLQATLGKGADGNAVWKFYEQAGRELGSFPAWRRILGWLNPISWWWTR